MAPEEEKALHLEMQQLLGDHSNNLAPSDAFGHASGGEGLASSEAAVAWCHSDNLAPSHAFGNASGGEGLASSDAAVAWKVTAITMATSDAYGNLEEKALHLAMQQQRTVTAITWRLVMHLVMHLEENRSHLVMQYYLGRLQR